MRTSTRSGSLSGLHPEWLIGLPLLAELPGVAWVAIAEAHIENYAGMYLGHAASPFALEARLAPRPDNPKVAVIGTNAVPNSPWRVRDAGARAGAADRIQHPAQPEPALGDRRHLVDQARQDGVELVVGQLRGGRSRSDPG